MSDTYSCCGAQKSWTRNTHTEDCSTRRAERASWAARTFGRDVMVPRGHDWSTCGCVKCEYKRYWLDRDDDLGAE